MILLGADARPGIDRENLEQSRILIPQRSFDSRTNWRSDDSIVCDNSTINWGHDGVCRYSPSQDGKGSFDIGIRQYASDFVEAAFVDSVN